MGRKLKKCKNADCHTLTNGVLCKRCSVESRRTSGMCTRDYKREWNLNKKYGLDNSGYDALWIAFKGRCGICNIELQFPTQTQGQPINAAALDHDHKTGHIRGLLCNKCNKALGFFDDNIELIKKAIAWLEMSNEKTCDDSKD